MSPVPAAVPADLEPGAGDDRSIVLSFRWGWYALSFLVPFAGIFIALFLYDQDSREVRRVGRNCLFIGFLIWVVFPFAVVAGLLLLGVLAVAGMAANILSPS